MTTLVDAADHIFDEAPEGRGVMAVLNRTGDTKVIWDPDVPHEVANARRTFDEMTREKGYSAFSVNRKGDKDKKVTSFDPDAEALILAPALVGG